MSDDDLLAEAVKRFDRAAEDHENRDTFVDDLEFYAGDQWPEQVKRDRELQQRACLTVNRMPQFVRQVTNDQRQNRPAVKVRPVDDNADVETAEVLSGLVRHIEANSAADIAYDTAFFYAVAGGFGYYRVVTDYCNERTFDQDIFIRPIPNPLTVFPDPDATSPDGSDWEYCFIVDEIPRDEFEKLYPDATEWDRGNIGRGNGWVTDEKVRVAEYFYIAKQKKTLLQLSDGSAILEDEYKQLPPEQTAMLSVIDKRDTEVQSVKWAKLGGHTVLEKKDWAGKYIPVIPVYGDAVTIDGKRKLFSLIRFAKDPQRMLNYYRSTETELMALQPKAPFVIAEGQVEGYEDVWQNANSANYAYLPYKPTTVAGVAVPAPQRQQFASVPTGVMQGALNAESDLKSTTGIYDSALGAKSNETSGVAIHARDQQSDVATFNFIDNMTRSIRQCGRVLLDLIPRIYDTPRVVRILGEDGSEEMKEVNQPIADKDKYGNPIERIFDLSTGEYDVVVAAGPSYSTKRQEAADAMMQMMQTAPDMMKVAGDLIVKNMDWPGAEDIAERIKKTLPPEVVGDDEQQPLPPQVQQQMQQHQQLIQQLDSTVQKMSEELEKKDIEWYKAQTDRLTAEANAAKNLATPDASNEIAEVKMMLIDIMQGIKNPAHLDPLPSPQAVQGQPQELPQPEQTPPQAMDGMQTDGIPQQ